MPPADRTEPTSQPPLDERSADRSSDSSGNSDDEPTRVSSGRGSGSGPGAPVVGVVPPIEGYELGERLHHGGQGVVYRAVQLGTKRVVAIKVLLEGSYASETARRRFEREVELAASLQHPAIVTILDSGISHGCYYFAMEYIEGQRLDDYLRSRRPSLRETLLLLERICEAVNYAHQRGVIHRDLKPSNILVDEQGNPHVLDFGLAKLRGEHDPAQTTVQALSMPGQVLGTLAYMSPEQAAGARDVDVRSDVYSLGVIAYEALLGRYPYLVNGPLGEVLNRIAHDEPQRPRQLRSRSRFGNQIDDELETILLKALEKDPARRYQSAGELARDIRHYLAGEPIGAKRASGLYVLRKTLRRYRLQTAFAAVLLTLLVAFTITLAVRYQTERELRTEAERLRTLASDRAERALQAELSERQARKRAELEKRLAQQAARERQLALLQQMVQAGDLALARGDLAAARDAYWDAFGQAPDALEARIGLRQYYLTTGEQHAVLLHVDGDGPISISADGVTAAVCESPTAITVRDLASGAALGWYPTPGRVVALSIDSAGRVAAAGDTWLRLWQPGHLQPAGIVELSGPTQPLAVCSILDGWGLLLVEPTRVRSYQTSTGRLLSEYRLDGRVTANPQRSPDGMQMAVVTEGGVTLIEVASDGRLRARRIWDARNDGPARSVRFVGGKGLAVLSDGVYMRLLAEGNLDSWTRMLLPSEQWDMLDFARGGGVIALAAHDGRVAVYRGGKLVRRWRVGNVALQEIRLNAAGDMLVTRDNRGSLTRWSARNFSPQAEPLITGGVVDWAVARRGQGGVLVDEEGQLHPFHAAGPHRRRAFIIPSLLKTITGFDPDELSLAIDADGRTLVVVYDDAIWIKRPGRRGLTPLRWSSTSKINVHAVAISDNRRLIALAGARPAAAQEAVVFLAVPPARRGKRTMRAVAAEVPLPGADILDLTFIPDSEDVLVARSDGELLRVSLRDRRQRNEKNTLRRVVRGKTWRTLEAPARMLRFSPDGSVLAAWCDDGLVRVWSFAERKELTRFRVRSPAGAMSFSQRQPLLTVRSRDGDLIIHDYQAARTVGHWPLSNFVGTPLIAWLEADKQLMLSYGDSILRVDVEAIDRLIEQNRIYAAQRRIVRLLADYDSTGAWNEAQRLVSFAAEAGRAAREIVIERLLQRRRARFPAEWVDTVLADAPPVSWLRLGHAAYAGGRFQQALDLLATGIGLSRGPIDAYTRWRTLECQYLLEGPEKLADRLAQLAGRPDLDPRDALRVRLEQIAALAAAGRADELAGLLRSLPADRRLRRLHGSAPALATQLIGMTLLDNVRGSGQWAGLLERITELAAPYRNDLEFFMGELARQAGRTGEARLHYRNCVDLSRDEWPADWARFRLKQLQSAKASAK